MKQLKSQTDRPKNAHDHQSNVAFYEIAEENDKRFSTVEESIDTLRQGKMIILLDSQSRENEGDLVIAAEKCTAAAINFMASFGKGLICVPLTPERANEINLPLMTAANNERHGTSFTVSVDLIEGNTTGISAYERARTAIALADPNAKAKDFARPGHMFPLIARERGLLDRWGQTEGSIDLLKISGMTPVSVICEIMKDNGEMARLPDLIEFAKEHQMPMISNSQVLDYRKRHEILVKQKQDANLPTTHGDFTITPFESMIDHKTHLALTYGDISDGNQILTRVHSQCITGDIFGSLRCDCADQLHTSMDMIREHGAGLVIYLMQEGRGIGLANKIKAYHLQDQGLDTVEANEELGFPADIRDFSNAAHILKLLNINSVRLLTNNLKKVKSLEHFGIKVTERLPLIIEPNQLNKFYLETKKKKMGHMI